MAGTLPIRRVSGEEAYGALHHLALARVCERSRRLLQRDPAGLGDLVVVVVGRAPDVVAQEEAHGLADPAARAAVPVRDVAELRADGRGQPGLLAHLADGRGLRLLVGVRAAL